MDISGELAGHSCLLPALHTENRHQSINALHLELTQGPIIEKVLSLLLCRLTDQYGPGLGQLLQAESQVDRVAHHRVR